jgi:hypothetical protein
MIILDCLRGVYLLFSYARLTPAEFLIYMDLLISPPSI